MPKISTTLSPWYLLLFAGALAVAGVLALILSAPGMNSPGASSHQLLDDAKSALKRGKYDAAEKLAAQIPASDRYFAQGQLVAGEAATRAGRIMDAIDHYSRIERDGSEQAVIAAFSTAEQWRDLGNISKAEREYAYVLERQPNNVAAHERMAFLLGVTGRRWESLPHFMVLLKSGSSSFEELSLLGDLDRPVEQPDYVERCQRNAPDDIMVRLAMAAQSVTDGRSADALKLLTEITSKDPELVAAQVMLGELLVDSDPGEFAKWHRRLPRSAEDCPETWFVRGMRARHIGEMRIAARCFWEAVRRDPTHRRSNYQLGQTLSSLEDPAAQEFTRRSGQLFKLSQSLDDVLRSKGQDERAVLTTAELLESTGRIWEACGWAALAARRFPTADWALPMAKRLSVQLSDDLPRTIASENLALKVDLSRYPDHRELLADVAMESKVPAVPGMASQIRFVESGDVGLDFVYENGADPTTPGARMFEQTGGGVAVLDFDGDDAPDLFLPQGGDWPTGSRHPDSPGVKFDRLFRNLGASFVDVTQAAGLVDIGFGQGCAAGDFDNDGFADLYVANIGRNQLYRNNGDGTFTDVSPIAGLQEEEWTASCAIVDLNSDGIPDLYSVNYLTADDIFEAICKGKACSPKVFEGVPDRVHISLADGAFEVVPDATPKTDSKGLGIVAVDLQTRNRPSLFIANDQVPNFLLRNLPSGDRFNIHLENDGFVSGLAFNQDGLAMASMGIAADDANGDGRIDFYVTTFKDEAKILFLQDAGGFFVDATKSSGLLGPGLPFVGWGTQFLDADLDGHPDLVVTNGHVDDYRSEGGEYQMRPQLFRNTGGGRFVELRADTAGPWFDRKYLGRGLARLDWNCDGLMDFVVSNIGDRASLVTNQSRASGHFLNIRLHATTTSRDAIGSIVEVATEVRRLSKQLVAGDGYMASNERLLQFGLGEASVAGSVRVQWPSGRISTASNVPANATVVLIEGRPRGILHRGQQSSEIDLMTSWPADQ